MKKFLAFSLSDVVFIMLISVGMPTFVGILTFMSSGAGNDNNHAHPDTSMKLGRNGHWHELLEFFSLANQNWSVFKMAALKSKMAATINVKS